MYRALLPPLLFVACVTEPDVHTRTYPGAGDFLEVTVAALKTDVPAPGSYNVRCVVRERFPCPPCPSGAVCAPCPREGVLVIDVAGPDRATLFIASGNPVQFLVDRKYLMSVAIAQRGLVDSWGWARVLGYDLLE